MSSVEQQEHLSIVGQIIEGQTLDQAGHEVRVTVIQGGTSKNGYAYQEAALQRIAQLIEGAHAYADHARTQADTTTRSVRDVVGFYHDAQVVAPSGSANARVDATLHIFEAADWLWSLIAEACTLGRPELIGLSIDIFGTWQVNEANKAKEVSSIAALNSCDIVTRPSAGGTFRRILHSDEQGDAMPHTTEAVPESQDEQLPAAATPPVTPPTSSPPTVLPPAATPASVPPVPSHITEQHHLFEQQRLQVEQLMATARLERAALLLERRLHESILPSAVTEQIKGRFAGRVFEESELDAEMTAALTMMASLTRDGIVRGHNYEKPSIGEQITEAEKVQAAFDAMFGLDIDTSKLGNVRAFSSIRDAYARVTGDTSVVVFSDRSTLGTIRVSESAPLARITEADTTTASFSYLLGTSMNKRLLKDYQAWPAEWQKFVTLVPIRDFKQQSRVRLGAFGSLAIVPEDTAYTAVTLTDSAATYVPQKRGNLVTVSRETILNDDLQAIKQIPTKLAVAAAYTLAEFVYGFLSTNPNIYDGNALFTSGAPHSNMGS